MGLSYLVVNIETIPKEQKDVPKRIWSYFETKRWNKEVDGEKRSVLISKDRCLHPALSELFCCGLMSGNKDLLLKGEEEKILSKFWEVIKDRRKEYGYNLLFVTFNGIAFDFPYLELKSRMLGLDIVNLPKKKYDVKEHFDVRMVLTNWDNYGFGNLYFWADVFGIEYNRKLADIFDVSDVGGYKSDKMDMLYEHCLQDLNITEQLFLKLIGEKLK